MRTARADLVTVVLPAGDGELRVDVAVGTGAEQLSGMTLPITGSLSGQVFSTGVPVRQSIADRETAVIAAAAMLDLGPVLAVPLLGSTQVRGVLWAGRRGGQPAFGPEELDMAAGFANQAALAIELAEARAEQQRVAMLDERDRIAADLHDHVIQRLFAAGLGLQSTAATLGPGRRPTGSSPPSTIWTTRFDRSVPASSSSSRSDRPPSAACARGCSTWAAELTAVLGFAPSLRLSGLLDTLSDDLGEDVVAVARESLTNVARHARAGSVEIDVAAVENRITVDVRDDGIGFGIHGPTQRAGQSAPARGTPGRQLRGPGAGAGRDLAVLVSSDQLTTNRPDGSVGRSRLRPDVEYVADRAAWAGRAGQQSTTESQDQLRRAGHAEFSLEPASRPRQVQRLTEGGRRQLELCSSQPHRGQRPTGMEPADRPVVPRAQEGQVRPLGRQRELLRVCYPGVGDRNGEVPQRHVRRPQPVRQVRHDTGSDAVVGSVVAPGPAGQLSSHRRIRLFDPIRPVREHGEGDALGPRDEPLQPGSVGPSVQIQRGLLRHGQWDTVESIPDSAATADLTDEGQLVCPCRVLAARSSGGQGDHRLRSVGGLCCGSTRARTPPVRRSRGRRRS